MVDSYWTDKRKVYEEAEGFTPSIFAEFAVAYFPESGSILELGAGRGQDSKYFAEQGYRVESTDLVIDDEDREFPKLVSRKTVDLRQPLPYEDEAFDVVYAHLALHYFDSKITTGIFEEVMRVLKPGGIFALLVNSVNDPEYGTGSKLEENYFETDGTKKRYFSQKTAAEFGVKFEILVCDEEGETYKDQAKGVHNLVRFVGKRRGDEKA